MTAVKMALQRAIKADEVLRQTFCFFALCASEKLPLEAVVKFVRARITDQPEELIKAKILRSSLILVSADHEDRVERLFLSLHNIVHAVLEQDASFYVETWERNQRVADAVKIFKSLLELNKENYALLKKITPHCKFLLEHVKPYFTSIESDLVKLTVFITVDEVVDWLGSLADAYQYLSDFLSARHVACFACNLIENISDTGDGSLLKVRIFSIYGNVSKNWCRRNAKEMLEKALLIRKKILGEEHYEVATSYNDLGTMYGNIRNYSQAKELIEKALTIRKKIFDEEHSDVAASYNDLGAVYFGTGEYNQAKKLYEKALMIDKKICGEDHIHIATSYNNLGQVYYKIGEYNQAEELFKKALIIKKKKYGEEHAAVGTGFNNLGQVYLRIGEYDKAKDTFEKALMIQKKIFGEEHALVKTIYNNLGVVFVRTGKTSKAKELFVKAREIEENIELRSYGRVQVNFATFLTLVGKSYFE